MTEIHDWALEVMLIYGSLAVALGVWLLCNVVFSYCICCHPSLKSEVTKKEKDEVELKTGLDNIQ